MKSKSIKNIIFFDGVCGLCNGFVDFILKIDSDAIFIFSPLQSTFAAETLPLEHIQNLNSVVVLIDGELYTKSKAVLKVLERIGGKWKILSFISFLPLSILNPAYDFVASNRYKLFGKKETCRIPTANERSRFVL